MGMVRIHAAANAKSMAMAGRLLADRDYLALLDMESEKEFIDYLRKHTYLSAAFIDAEEQDENVGYLIKKHMLGCIDKLYYFYVDAYRAFFKTLMMRYEVENIKLYLRAFSRNEDISLLKHHIAYSNVYSSIDYAMVGKASDMREFIDSLRDTKYYSQLEGYMDEEPSKMLFYMEMVLDRTYFSDLHESILKLEAEDREKILRLYGINVDLLNIQWIYRGRKFFGIASEELFNFTLNNGRRYNFEKLKALCYMDLEKYKKLISEGDYKFMFDGEEYLMEVAMERHLFNITEYAAGKERMSIVIPVVYIMKIEYEMRDLITIYEGIRYGYEGIEDFLVRNLRRVE
ncbi:MAG: V-type ATPase subunit [Peptostreptococcaceae bacterium]|nr:V-type ATPase subunit [Peptostreptococcaceae bacterium]